MLLAYESASPTTAPYIKLLFTGAAGATKEAACGLAISCAAVAVAAGRTLVLSLSLFSPLDTLTSP